MQIDEYVQDQFREILDRHRAEIEQLAARCAEVCESDGRREGFQHGLKLDDLAMRVLHFAERFVSGKDPDEKRLREAVRQWKDVHDENNEQ